MTQTRKLKQAIRARAKKTGESYAAARRQYLKPATPPPPATPPKKAAGGMTEASARRATGHGLDHWFAVLDAFSPGGVKGHTAAARQLADHHGVPGWHAQGITVAWERARGHRAMNQGCTGTFNVSVSRVVPAEVAAVAAALQERAQRARWLANADPALARALSAALDGGKSKGLSSRARTACGCASAGTTARSSCASTQRVKTRPAWWPTTWSCRTPRPSSRRAAWKDALDGLKAYLASPRQSLRPRSRPASRARSGARPEPSRSPAGSRRRLAVGAADLSQSSMLVTYMRVRTTSSSARRALQGAPDVLSVWTAWA